MRLKAAVRRKLKKAIARPTPRVWAGSKDLLNASRLAKEHEVVCGSRMFYVREGRSSGVSTALHLHCGQCKWNVDATSEETNP